MRNHKYFWEYVKKHFPNAVEEHYYDGIELDFWPSETARDNDDGSYASLLSCHHDLETGELQIYSGEW